MGNKKYYAVVKGRKPGIYEEWFGADGAEAQVKGFPGAVYKGFGSYAEASDFVKGPGTGARANRQKPAGRKPVQAETVSAGPGDPGQAPHDALLAAGRTIIYTDGGCIHNPGPGGYGAVLFRGEERTELSGGYRRTTNNRMELMACIKGLQFLEESSSVAVYSDSRYVVNGIEKGWAKRWRANDWMRNDTDRAENSDLWAELLELCERHDVRFLWLKGHNNTEENERCDRLCSEAARSLDLPADPGFK